MKCCVRYCLSDSKKPNKNKGLTFHWLPKDPAHGAAWVKAVSRLGVHDSNGVMVCSKHFVSEDFQVIRHNHRRLKDGAVPTIMNPDIQKELKVCRSCLALDVKMYDMKNYKLSEMFQNITGILAIDNTDRILQRLCWECVGRLTAAATFRDKALLSDSLLKDLVEINTTNIVTLSKNHTSLKSPLTVHSVFTSTDIECEFTIPENNIINEEENELDFERNEDCIEPIEVSKEDEPGDNETQNQDDKSDTFSVITLSDDSLMSTREDSQEEIPINEVQSNNNEDILKEDTESKMSIIISKGKFVTSGLREQNPKVIVTVINEESSSANGAQNIADFSVSKPKQKQSRKIRVPKEKVTIRNYKINDRLKEKIIAMKKNDLPVSAIAKETGLTMASIICWWIRYEKNVCKKTKSITPKINESVAKQNNQCSLAESGKGMGRCSEIVRQRLHEAGLEDILMKKPEDNVNVGKKINERKARREDLKQRIIALKGKSISSNRTAYLLNTSQNTVNRWWNRWRNEGHMRHKNTGKKNKTTPQRDQPMMEVVKPTVPTPSLAMELGITRPSTKRQNGASLKDKDKKSYVLLKTGRTQKTSTKRQNGTGLKHKEKKPLLLLKTTPKRKVDEKIKQTILSLIRKDFSLTCLANQFKVPRATIASWVYRLTKKMNMKVTNANRTNASAEQKSCIDGAHIKKSLQTTEEIS